MFEWQVVAVFDVVDLYGCVEIVDDIKWDQFVGDEVVIVVDIRYYDFDQIVIGICYCYSFCDFVKVLDGVFEFVVIGVVSWGDFYFDIGGEYQVDGVVVQLD